MQAPDSALALSYAAPGRPLVWPGRFVFGANHPVQDENDSLKPGPTLDPDPAGCAMAVPCHPATAPGCRRFLKLHFGNGSSTFEREAATFSPLSSALFATSSAVRPERHLPLSWQTRGLHEGVGHFNPKSEIWKSSSSSWSCSPSIRWASASRKEPIFPATICSTGLLARHLESRGRGRRRARERVLNFRIWV